MQALRMLADIFVAGQPFANRQELTVGQDIGTEDAAALVRMGRAEVIDAEAAPVKGKAKASRTRKDAGGDADA